MATTNSKSNATNKDKKSDATKADEAEAPAKDDHVPAGAQARSDAEVKDVPEKPEERKEDLAAENEEDVEASSGDFGFLGTTAERDVDGKEYDVPWTYLTGDDVEASKPRTSDWDDAGRSWTAQEVGQREEAVALVDVQATPGQVFRVRELPNRAVAEEAGIDYANFVTGLPVRPDVKGEAPRRGTPA